MARPRQLLFLALIALIATLVIAASLILQDPIVTTPSPTTTTTDGSGSPTPGREPNQEDGADPGLEEARIEEALALEDWERARTESPIPEGCEDRAADPATCGRLTELLEAEMGPIDSADAALVAAHAAEVRELASEIRAARKNADLSMAIAVILERQQSVRDRHLDPPRYHIPDPIPRPTPKGQWPTEER